MNKTNMYNSFKTHVVEDINYLMDSSVQSSYSI